MLFMSINWYLKFEKVDRSTALSYSLRYTKHCTEEQKRRSEVKKEYLIDSYKINMKHRQACEKTYGHEAKQC